MEAQKFKKPLPPLSLELHSEEFLYLVRQDQFYIAWDKLLDSKLHYLKISLDMIYYWDIKELFNTVKEHILKPDYLSTTQRSRCTCFLPAVSPPWCWIIWKICFKIQKSFYPRTSKCIASSNYQRELCKVMFVWQWENGDYRSYPTWLLYPFRVKKWSDNLLWQFALVSPSARVMLLPVTLPMN